jgi:hypothetical protein
MITESDRLAEALDSANALWPEMQGGRAALLRRIIDAGVGVIEREQANEDGNRRAVITGLAGSMAGVWPEGWRDELRDEWPT